MRRRLAIALSFGLACGSAAAQTPVTPVMGSAAEETAPVPAGEQEGLTHVLVLGDAIGGGLGAGLLRLLEANDGYEVTLRFNEESGLARPEVYDWPATLPKILASGSYDVIVVMLGTNDRQMVRTGNERHAFNSPSWIAAYNAQMDKLLDELAASGAKVYWVELPPMQDPEYDVAMQVIAALQRARVEARGMTYLGIRRDLSAADGSYTDTGPDETGEVKRLRGKDGISFFKAGNNRMGQLVLAAIESAGAEPPVKTAKAEVPDLRPQREEPNARDVPLFGQSLMLGDTFTIRPDDVTADAVLMATADLAPDDALNAIRAMAPEGSPAALLFKLGQVSPAPKGRADDFSVPPPASE
ncbi:DUF459 domain-containing protein [Aestuariivirga sp.]|uniref:SGNH/GDSL hydrolase family protein n=1 Tax=Aestuariivirga sp. TaxID=2650926 RepID=UPI003593A5A0